MIQFTSLLDHTFFSYSLCVFIIITKGWCNLFYAVVVVVATVRRQFVQLQRLYNY